MKIQTASKSRWADFSLMFPIVGSHIERIGLTRTAAGGLSMYLAIPMFINFQVTLAFIAYQCLLKPLLGLPTVRWRDHVILDRHRIKDIPWFDRLNCLYCGYANGLCTMINVELDHLANEGHNAGGIRRRIAGMIALFFLPALWLNEWLGVRFVYDRLVAPPLGMHHLSREAAAELLQQQNYAEQWRSSGTDGAATGIWTAAIRYAKNTMLRLSSALEQIESSWCPLHHFEQREGVVYPEHHKKFFGADQIEQMRQQLLNQGTVSDKIPFEEK